jgi:hypothetical protein
MGQTVADVLSALSHSTPKIMVLEGVTPVVIRSSCGDHGIFSRTSKMGHDRS